MGHTWIRQHFGANSQRRWISHANIAAINKFTYLCGFLGPKVKRRVGWEREENIHVVYYPSYENNTV